MNKDTGLIPDHADNKAIRKNPDIYHYPHDDVGSINLKLIFLIKLGDYLLWA